MTFQKRLQLYLFGVFLGIIVVYFLLFHNRQRNLTSWLPSNRIYIDIAEKPFDLNDSTTLKFIKCFSSNVDTALVKNIILATSINFGKSKVHQSEYPVYYLETLNPKEDFNAEIQITKHFIKIVNIHSPVIEKCKNVN